MNSSLAKFVPPRLWGDLQPVIPVALLSKRAAASIDRRKLVLGSDFLGSPVLMNSKA